MTARDDAWRAKAHHLIGALSRASWESANRMPNGRLRKKHVPYSIPEVAQRLIKALDENDEETAKSIFMYDYEISKLPPTKRHR